ncbi:MAG: hypothetical protein Tsb0010_11830 [Parvularculaceae bacterium]
MKKFLLTAASVLGAIHGVADAAADTLWRLSRDCETALALSAGPTYLRDGAGVYVLGDKEFELIRESENGYVCLVQRNADEALIPQCFDRMGQWAHVPVHKDVVKKRLAGMEWSQIFAEQAQGFVDGTYKRAPGPGVVYMASDFNFTMDFASGNKRKIWPHVMYHAPDVTHADIGSDPQEAVKNPGMPIIAGQGPLGYMISFVDHPTDSADVEARCAGQLPDPDDYLRFPPGLN